MERLPGNTKNRLFARSWTARVRLVNPWAVLSDYCATTVQLLCNYRATTVQQCTNRVGKMKPSAGQTVGKSPFRVFLVPESLSVFLSWVANTHLDLD